MADGVPITAGVGTTIATDDCGAAGHAQVIKLATSTDGSAALVDVGGLLTSIKTAVELLDNAIAGTEIQADIVAALPAGTNNIGDVDVVTVPAPLSSTGGGTEAAALRVTLANDSTGLVSVDDNAGSLTVDNAGLTELAAAINALNQLDVNIADVTAVADGSSLFRSIDLDETEEEVKATQGIVYGMWVTNTATATRWIKFYNATAANVTVGTTAPVLTIGIPGNSSDDVSGVFTAGGPGINFATAITVAATTGVADSDTGAPGLNEVIVNIGFS